MRIILKKKCRGNNCKANPKCPFLNETEWGGICNVLKKTWIDGNTQKADIEIHIKKEKNYKG